VLRHYGYGATSGLPATGYQVPPCTMPGHTTVHSTQYQSYVLQYITYVVRTRSTFYVLPSAEPSDSGCLQGADASATGFSEKACRYPSLTKISLPTSYHQDDISRHQPFRPTSRHWPWYGNHSSRYHRQSYKTPPKGAHNQAFKEEENNQLFYIPHPYRSRQLPRRRRLGQWILLEPI